MFAFNLLVLLSMVTRSQLHEPCYYHPNITLPIPLAQHQTVYFKEQNILYVFGGETADNGSMNAIYKWNISDPNGSFNMISEVTPTPIFRSTINNVVVIGNNAYFIGVYDGSYTSGSMYIFNIKQESFIDNSNYATPIHKFSFGCLTTNDSHILMVSGYNGNLSNLETSYSDYLQIYELNSNQWIGIKIPFLTGWTDQYCTMVDNTLFVMGGYMVISEIQEMYKWDWQNGWNYIGTKPEKSRQGTVSYYNSYIYLIGGGYPAKNTIDVFYTENETVIHTYYMLHSLYYLSSSIIHGKLYLFGGRSNSSSSSISSAIQICDLTTMSRTEYSGSNPSEAPKTTHSDNSNSNSNDTYLERYFTEFYQWILLVLSVITICCCIFCGLIIIMYQRKLKHAKLSHEMEESNKNCMMGSEMVQKNVQKDESDDNNENEIDIGNKENDDDGKMDIDEDNTCIKQQKSNEGQALHVNDRLRFKDAASNDSAISAYEYGMVIKTPKPKSFDQLQVMGDNTTLNRTRSDESMYYKEVGDEGLKASPSAVLYIV